MAELQSWHLLYLIFPALVLLHLRISPFTKVEESFNIQAAYDILNFGVPTQNVALRLKAQYDHMTFPGAVPRTFIGAMMLAAIAKPLSWFQGGMQQQQVVRAVLGLFNASALVVYAMGVKRAFGKGVSTWYICLQASQFHVFYYASRTLPNMFAFGLSTFALRFLLPDPVDTATRIKRTRLAFYLLTITTVIFRAEMGLLIAAHCFYLLTKATTADARASLFRRVMIPAGLSGLFVGLALAVSIDTYFWQSEKPLWPELEAFFSNVFPAKGSLGASAWGTSPWYWYFTSAIPRLFLNPLVFYLFAIAASTPALQTQAQDLLTPNLTYVALYSLLSHKETRFLFPILPPLTTAAALAASNLAIRKKVPNFILPLLVTTTILTALVSHALLLPLSSLNYPGATALSLLHSTAHNTRRVIDVHLDNLTLQTGVTRFLQMPAPDSPLIVIPGDAHRRGLQTGATRWRYDKTENATALLDPVFWDRFNYVIVETPAKAIGRWEVVERVKGLGRLRVVRPHQVYDAKLGVWEDVLRATYGEWAVQAYLLFREVVRDGYGFTGVLAEEWSWTGGWWLELGMEDKLYILKQA